MKVKVQGDKIVVTTENRNDNFNWLIRSLVAIDTGAKIRISKAYPLGKVHDIYEISEHDFSIVNGLVRAAESCGIEVEPAVIERRDELDRQRHELFEKKRRDREEREKREHWKYLQKHGCDGCKNLCMHTDVFYCRKTGKELETKRQPKFDGWTNTFYLFNLDPFPSADCPLKAE